MSCRCKVRCMFTIYCISILKISISPTIRYIEPPRSIITIISSTCYRAYKTNLSTL
nr:MAG TPA: hypothetical protein [Bacteriophage sp.]